MKEKTLSIIKPDGTKRNLIGNILARFEKAGLKIVAAKMLLLSRKEAIDFYQVHQDRPFFPDLITFITSGPVFVSVLEGEQAVEKHRALMGATDPKKAALGTIRKEFSPSIEANTVHGSDSLENALKEITFFFPQKEIF